MTRMTYDETMAWGAAQYADALGALRQAGHLAEFTQTGGMCAALLITLEAGYYVLVTDEEDTLSWYRRDHAGWCVGLYADPDMHAGTQGAMRVEQTPDGSIAALLPLVDHVLNVRAQATASPYRTTRMRWARRQANRDRWAEQG